MKNDRKDWLLAVGKVVWLLNYASNPTARGGYRYCYRYYRAVSELLPPTLMSAAEVVSSWMGCSMHRFLTQTIAGLCTRFYAS
jgi:hypothetical protein